MSEETKMTTGPSFRDKDMAPGDGKFRGKRRRKVSYLTVNKITTVDYKDVAVLKRFINDRGKMLPTRQTGNTAKQQRMISNAIRRARELALLPFVVTEMAPERRERDSYRRGPRHEAPQDAPQAEAAEGATEAKAAPKPRAKKAEAAPVEAPEAETPAAE